MVRGNCEESVCCAGGHYIHIRVRRRLDLSSGRESSGRKSFNQKIITKKIENESGWMCERERDVGR